MTPLMLASAKGHMDLVDFVLSQESFDHMGCKKGTHGCDREAYHHRSISRSPGQPQQHSCLNCSAESLRRHARMARSRMSRPWVLCAQSTLWSLDGISRLGMRVRLGLWWLKAAPMSMPKTDFRAKHLSSKLSQKGTTKLRPCCLMPELRSTSKTLRERRLWHVRQQRGQKMSRKRWLIWEQFLPSKISLAKTHYGGPTTPTMRLKVLRVETKVLLSFSL